MIRTLVTTGAALLWAACGSPIVGDRCQLGFVACDGECVDVFTDANHCGACGNVCAGEQLCVAGTCRIGGDFDVPMDAGDLGGMDRGPRDGGPDAGPVDIGPDLDRGRPDGGLPPGCDVGEIFCDGGCVDPLTNGRYCGDCDTQCLPSEFCIDGVCEPRCEIPLVQCGELCVDLDSDPDYCGDCTTVCVSGLCADGACVGGTAGDLVVIGHDFEVSRVGQNRVAGNSVFQAAGNPVRVLVYEGAATSFAIGGMNNAINQVGVELGRTWTRRPVVDSTDVPFELATADAFVILAQDGATNAELSDLGVEWSVALQTFLETGGVVVLSDTPSATNDGTHQILVDAGLFTATGITDVTGAELDVVALSDSVARGLPFTYRGEENTVTFEGTVAPVVVNDGTDPVVLHVVFRP